MVFRSVWGSEIKIRVAVPNSWNSSTSKASKAEAKVSTELESIIVSGDERSTGSTETYSPVIKVYGSNGALETTEAEDRINPY